MCLWKTIKTVLSAVLGDMGKIKLYSSPLGCNSKTNWFVLRFDVPAARISYSNSKWTMDIQDQCEVSVPECSCSLCKEINEYTLSA